MEIDELIGNEFSRNIGLLSHAEQELLLKSRVAIAGAGGVGGVHALTLARLGVGKFSIADGDSFDRANISRQFGASRRTFGKNKAEVLAEMIREINPDAEVRCLTEAVTSDNLEFFLEDAAVYIDGIEFFEVAIRRQLFSRCRQLNIYGVTAAPVGFGSTLQVFAPDGMSFDRYFGLKDGMDKVEMAAAFAVGLAPRPFYLAYLDLRKIDVAGQKAPAVVPACTLAASWVATEVVKILTGKGAVRPAPVYQQLDMIKGQFVRKRLVGGGRHPLQRFKKHLLLGKLQKLRGNNGL